MKKQHNRGFTLIELLVVIAIIGILAALVLVALGNARQKANDARIKSSIGQLRTLAEVHYDSASSTYTGFGACVGGTAASCAGNISGSVNALTADIAGAGGTAAASLSTSGAQVFCVASTLASDATIRVRVDQAGSFTEGTGVAACS